MVNTNSTSYKFSEKIGLAIGKMIRYIVIGGIVFLIGGKLGDSTPSQKPPAPPA
jgi:sulfite exporter TauE/SafE